MGESGWNPGPGKDQPSSSPSPADEAARLARHRILVVEDNRADIFLIRESIETARVQADLHIVQDGEKAAQFLDDVDADPLARVPSLIILDINLPRMPGWDVLRHMRKSRRCADTPVLVVTSSDSRSDRDEMAKLGVKHYFRKPSEYDGFMKLGGLVKEVLGVEPNQ